jgi:acyl transferase domain-containing protein/acyl carrier protein
MKLQADMVTSADRGASSTPAAEASAVAIVGMACRFAGAPNLASFWELLRAGGDAVTEVPADRFDISRYYSQASGILDTTVSRHGGFLADVFGFDADFFGISPVEAKAMDPQQRLLLHVAWEALESAGLRQEDVRGTRTGVFVGQATAEYSDTMHRPQPDIRALTGSRLRSMAAGRVSFALDLRGPSITVDTACSSSLVAVHLARQSLLAGECDTAIVGGVNVILSPHDSIAYSQAGMMSPGGRCRFGAASADGFVRGEGIAAVVLRRLADTDAADRVPAVLLGSAVNNDGRSGGFLLQPSVAGQAEMLRNAYASAGVNPADVDYVEAHGTGTQVGDAIELSALADVMGAGRPADRPCVVGSVKSNIGHTEAAAGLAGLIKAVLILKHGTVPASLHCDDPAPMLRPENSPLVIPSSVRPLNRQTLRSVVGVSAFGLSGTNAHVVLSTPEATGAGADAHLAATGDAPGEMLTLSAPSAESLRDVANQWQGFLATRCAADSQYLSDVCYTANVRRQPQTHRLVVRGKSFSALADQLTRYLDGREHPRLASGYAGPAGRRRAVFVFSGQGGQWPGMGRQLYEAFPAYRSSFDRCDAAARPYLSSSLKDLLVSDVPVDAIEALQPLLWALQVAMAELWRSLGIEPDAVIGHSMGEVAAAHIAGVLSVTQAAEVICRRSAAMALQGKGGAMIWTDLPADAAQALVAHDPKLFIAADNSGGSRVLAGEAGHVARVSKRLQGGGTTCRPVAANVASHTPYMSAAAQLLNDELHALHPSPERLPFFSTCRPGPADGTGLDARYWADNLREPVRFSQALSAILDDGECMLVELSPHPVLQSSLAELQRATGHAEAVVSCTRRNEDEVHSTLAAMQQFHSLGGEIRWQCWSSPSSGLVDVPGHLWRSVPHRLAEDPSRPLGVDSCDIQLQDLDMVNPGWRSAIGGVAVMPCAAFLEAALMAARKSDPNVAWGLEEVKFHELYGVGPDRDPFFRVSSRVGEGTGTGKFSIAVIDDAGSDAASGSVCVTGRLRRGSHGGEAVREDLESALERCRRPVGREAFEQVAASYALAPSEQSPVLVRGWRGRNEAVATFGLPPGAVPSLPMIVEGGLQVLLLALPHQRAKCSRRPWIPRQIAAVRILGRPSDTLWSVATVRRGTSPGSAIADVWMFDQAGRLLVQLLGIELEQPGWGAPQRRVTGRAVSWLDRRRRSIPARVSARGIGVGIGFPPANRRLPQPWTGRAAVRNEDLSAAGEAFNPTPIAAEPQTRADFVGCLAAVLGTTRDRVDVAKSPREMGLDSLMAVQLRAKLHAEAGQTVTAATLLGYESVRRIAADLDTDEEAAGRRPASMMSTAASSSSFNADGFVPAPT